jgi:hypothetical protein
VAQRARVQRHDGGGGRRLQAVAAALAAALAADGLPPDLGIAATAPTDKWSSSPPPA